MRCDARARKETAGPSTTLRSGRDLLFARPATQIKPIAAIGSVSVLLNTLSLGRRRSTDRI
jgi:hypothetical protein